jgi:hypothetical protein
VPAIFWKQFAVDGIGNPRRSPPEIEALWTELFGGLWPMPPDNRVYFTFQKHVLLSLPPNRAEDIARSVRQWLKALCRGHSRFLVIDIGDNDGYFPYYTPLYNRTSPHEIT